MEFCSDWTSSLLLYSKNETIGLWKLKYVINTLDSNLFKYLKKTPSSVVPYFVVLSFGSFDIIKFNFAFRKSTKGFDLSFEKSILKSRLKIIGSLCRLRFRRADLASV